MNLDTSSITTQNDSGRPVPDIIARLIFPFSYELLIVLGTDDR